MIPSYSRKAISGWINYSCMVISHKIIERAIGYRGSKSVNLKNPTVKEQRVDGSWLINKLANPIIKRSLRCTLMDFERNYQVRIPSNLINKSSLRYYSSKSVQERVKHNLIMDPWFLTGFVDAEGCFTLGISRNKYCKTGWSIQLFFQIALHQKDTELLERIQNYFGVGKIYKHGPQSIIYRITSVKNLQVLFNHFDKYPLITQKFSDYILFKQIVFLMFFKKRDYMFNYVINSCNNKFTNWTFFIFNYITTPKEIHNIL